MENGDYICPICLSKMDLTKKPYTYENTFLGFYQAVECPVCGNYYFTENAMKEISNDYNRLKKGGLIREPLITYLQSISDTKQLLICNFGEDTNEKNITVGGTSSSKGEIIFSKNSQASIRKEPIKVVDNAT